MAQNQSRKLGWAADSEYSAGLEENLSQFQTLENLDIDLLAIVLQILIDSGDLKSVLSLRLLNKRIYESVGSAQIFLIGQFMKYNYLNLRRRIDFILYKTSWRFKSIDFFIRPSGLLPSDAFQMFSDIPELFTLNLDRLHLDVADSSKVNFKLLGSLASSVCNPETKLSLSFTGNPETLRKFTSFATRNLSRLEMELFDQSTSIFALNVCPNLTDLTLSVCQNGSVTFGSFPTLKYLKRLQIIECWTAFSDSLGSSDCSCSFPKLKTLVVVFEKEADISTVSQEMLSFHCPELEELCFRACAVSLQPDQKLQLLPIHCHTLQVLCASLNHLPNNLEHIHTLKLDFNNEIPSSSILHYLKQNCEKLLCLEILALILGTSVDIEELLGLCGQILRLLPNLEVLSIANRCNFCEDETFRTTAEELDMIEEWRRSNQGLLAGSKLKLVLLGKRRVALKIASDISVSLMARIDHLQLRDVEIG